VGRNAGIRELVQADQDQGLQVPVFGFERPVQQGPGQGLLARQGAQDPVAEFVNQGTIAPVLQVPDPRQDLIEGAPLVADPMYGAGRCRPSFSTPFHLIFHFLKSPECAKVRHGTKGMGPFYRQSP